MSWSGCKSPSITGNIVYDSVLEEFVQDIAWIWIPFVVILLLVNLLVARIGLAPLRMAANQAAAIGPGCGIHAADRERASARRPCACQRRQSGIGPTGNGLRCATAVHCRCRARAAHAGRRAQGACGHPRRNSKAMPSSSRKSAVSSGWSINCSTWRVSTCLQLGADNVADLTSVATEVASHLGPAAIDARPIHRGGGARRAGAHSRRAATICSGRCATSWRMRSAIRRKAPRSPSWWPIRRRSASSIADLACRPDQRTCHLSPFLAGRSRG